MERRALNPADRGAYALVLRLARETQLDIASLGRPMLQPGLYLYAGSARGSGGIRARVGRHMRQGKPRVWHIDHLTETAEMDRAIAFPGARECEIADFVATRGARAPIPRFGASDCRRCEAHLLVVEPDIVDALTPISLDKDFVLANTRT